MNRNHNTDIISYIRGIGDRNRRHVDCKVLDQALKTSAWDPSNIEYIAKDLAICDPKHITLHDVLVYSQVLEALKIVKIGWLKEKIINRWAGKLKSISCSLGPFKYNTSINKEEGYQEDKKTNEAEKSVETKKSHVIISEK